MTFLTQEINNGGRSKLLWQKVYSTDGRTNTMDPVSHKALAIDIHFVSGFSHLLTSEKARAAVMHVACIWKYPVRFRLNTFPIL
jgi:hypothetical protein